MRFPSFRLLAAAFLASAVFARAASEPIALWPGNAPGEKGGLPPEADTSKPGEGLVAGKPLIRLGNVSSPTITIFSPPVEKANGAAMLVCPGGGYHILAMDMEGTEVCEWLNSIGVTAVLLKYRVPSREGLPRHVPALQDAQRAMGIIRQRAGGWGIDPGRVGCIGFSAGGHLCAALAAASATRTYEAGDDADKLTCRPDFAMLVYPAYLTVKEQADAIAPDTKVTAQTPPTFLVQTQDDGVRVESSLFYYLALKNANVPAEMHLFPTGGHGYGLRPTAHNVTRWPERAAEWLKALGVLERKK